MLPGGSGIASRSVCDIAEFGEDFVAIDKLNTTLADLTDATIELGRPRSLPLLRRRLVPIVWLEAAQKPCGQRPPLFFGELERLIEHGLERGGHSKSIAQRGPRHDGLLGERPGMGCDILGYMVEVT